MEVIRSNSEFKVWRASARSDIALVPTMGSFHSGHLSLIQHARQLADTVIVSLFVNPTQFGLGEDLETYPRDFGHDVALAEERGADCLFAPPVQEMYGRLHATYVHWPELGARLCGKARPNHFQGVATIVLKLFNLVRPDLAVFGRKDGQQVLLIKRLVADLDLDIRIVVSPTIREPDGLAMSSRNINLTKSERTQALGLYTALRACKERILHGEQASESLVGTMHEALGQFPGLRPEYIEIVDRDSLCSVESIDTNVMVAAAARVESTRLIDNLWTYEMEGAMGVEL